jgi:hypothetical protein
MLIKLEEVFLTIVCTGSEPRGQNTLIVCEVIRYFEKNTVEILYFQRASLWTTMWHANHSEFLQINLSILFRARAQLNQSRNPVAVGIPWLLVLFLVRM